MSDLLARLEAAKAGSFVLDGEIRDLVIGKHPGTPLPYSVSIDAALLLVPQGWTWTLYVDATAPECLVDWCLIPPGEGEAIVIGQAATPALALCVAAIKAWEQG